MSTLPKEQALYNALETLRKSYETYSEKMFINASAAVKNIYGENHKLIDLGYGEQTGRWFIEIEKEVSPPNIDVMMVQVIRDKN